MTALLISGTAVLLDAPAADGRELSSDGLTVPREARPLLALHAGIRADLGAYADPVGTVTGWEVVRELNLPTVNDGQHQLVLDIAGEVYDDQRIPPGTYPARVDARFEPADAELHPDDRWPDTGRLLVRRWSPIAVTLFLPGAIPPPPFAAAVLTVEASR